MTKNTTDSLENYLATHIVLLYIIGSKNSIPTNPMGEIPWYLMENSAPCLCLEMLTIY
jgi:hypothetical protein